MDHFRIKRAQSSFDNDGTFGQKISRYPGRADIASHWSWLASPSRIRIDGDEDDYAFLVKKFMIRHEHMSRLQHLEFHFDSNWPADIDRFRGLIFFTSHADGNQTRDVVSRSFRNIGPVALCGGP